MKICIATGTRAEYGLLKPLIDKIRDNGKYQLQLLVTGAHLSPEFGLTYRQIEADGIEIDDKVEMLLSSDTPEGVVKSMGLGMIGFADSLKRLRPDMLVILGDRYEMLALASAALIFRVPIAHLHGGEITEGAYDDSIRHAISKLSNLHFTSTDSYRQRVIQMGEDPQFVFNVGAIGLDNIQNLPLLNKQELSKQLNIELKQFNYLVTFHPETLSDHSPESQFRILLEVIESQEESFFIFTYANSDTHGRIINQLINEYVTMSPEKAVAYHSMGQLKYLSAMKVATAVVGNSSSGIIEAPSFKIPSINIGDRQKGRIQAESVINVPISKTGIEAAFRRVRNREDYSAMQNPYGTGNTADKIIQVLQEKNLNSLRTKNFYKINGYHDL